ncbi:MAG: hypothetical protein EOP45_12195 [Sphingobacteriaceae bacterium]|nr:MAG: hypothetical protein EOP45_12195 [Sphingobacteriaceae bacterium]
MICAKYTIDKKPGWKVLINCKQLNQKLDGTQYSKLTKVGTIDFGVMDRINFRTKFKRSTCCAICGSEDRIEMHHINPLKEKKTEKDQWKSVYLLLGVLKIKAMYVFVPTQNFV